ncbi:MAG: hypothetical protein WC926_02685 [Candidatus Paceibacterota bacterium]|jgi:hypothetical protein
MSSEVPEQENICLNKDCWLVGTLGYSPADRCLICKLRFRECPFSQFLLTGSSIILASFVVSYILEKDVPQTLIISAFISFLVYGYLFNRSTKDIIESNCSLTKAKKDLEERAVELERFYRLTVGREVRMSELKKDIERLKAEVKK